MRSRLSRALPSALILIAALATHAPANAQRYNLRVLTQPSNVQGACEVATLAPLDDAGHVHGTCTYWTGGIYFNPNIAVPVPLLDTRSRSITWKPDGTRSASTYPTSGSVWVTLGRAPDGRLLADVIATPVRPDRGYVSLGVQAYNGSSWSRWTPPAPLTGAWSILQLSESGALLMKSADPARAGALAVQVGTTVRALPPVPLPATGEQVTQGWVNTAGQVIALARRPSGGTPLWFWWNGSSWLARTIGGVAPLEGTPVEVIALNNKGTALVSTRDLPTADLYQSPVQLQLWNPATDLLQPLPTRLSYHPSQGGLNDAGVVAAQNLPAGTAPSAGFAPRRATVWRNGQDVDLNTLVTLPAGGVLERSVAINARGQILAQLRLPDYKWEWALLTPQ